MRCKGRVKCMYMCSVHAFMLTPPDPSQVVCHSSLPNITHVPLQRAKKDPVNGQKFISSEPLGGTRDRHKKRERQEGTRLVCALLEREMDHG